MPKSFPLSWEAPETEGEAENFCGVLSTNLQGSEGVGHLQSKRTVTFPQKTMTTALSIGLEINDTTEGIIKSIDLH